MEAKTQNSRECKNCGQAFTPQRKDANFCSGTCRWTYWKSTKNEDGNPAHDKENPKQPKLLSNLQGVISQVQETQLKETKVINPLWTQIAQIKEATIKQLEKFRNELKLLNEAEKNIINENGNWMIYAGIVGGAISGDFIGSVLKTNEQQGRKNKIKPSNPNQGLGMLLGMIGGGLVGNAINKMTQNEREAKKKNALAEIQNKKAVWQQKVQSFQNYLLQLNERLFSTPQWNIEHKQVRIEQAPETKLNSAPKQKEIISDQSQKSLTGSSKIISSSDLEKLDYKALNFQDKWAHFFGYPSFNFHCVIHGMSGEGKSTFAIQFANYLAENFGKVIYVSGEEGFSKTFKDKFINNNAVSNNLFVADIRKLDEMFGEIPNDEYNFIFIDSLDNMRIDADGMKKIRVRYKDSALITISQSTKEGKMRGSYEIVHDSDIGVKVENGIAVTTKNRFKQKGLELTVF